MKKKVKVIAIAAIVIVFTDNSFAQLAATASSSVSIINPIAIVKNVDMNFGNVAVSATTNGTVILDPSGTRSSSGGITLPSTTGTVTAADFTVSGSASYTYSINIPSGAVLSNGTTNISLTSFVSNPATSGTLSTSGTQDLTIGATLLVIAGQSPGTYTNVAGVPVTVNYN